jgi:hydroxyethylthiazole kinase
LLGSPSKLPWCRELIRHEPTVLRLNAAEFVALAGRDPTVQGIAACALETLSIVALTGPTDLVTDGLRHALIENGHPLMAKVTTMGCAGSAVAAAFLAAENDRTAAFVAGLAVMGIVGERVAATARGPGSFAVAMLDALAALSPEDVAGSARIR